MIKKSMAVLKAISDVPAMTLVALNSPSGTWSCMGLALPTTISIWSGPSAERLPPDLEAVGAKMRRWYQSLEPGARGSSFRAGGATFLHFSVRVRVAFLWETSLMPRSRKPAVKSRSIASVSQAPAALHSQPTETA